MISRRSITPAMDETRVQYLLLHLGVPSAIQPEGKGPLHEAKQAAASCGFVLRTVRVATTEYDSGMLQYLFRDPDHSRVDAEATRFAEDFLYSASAIYGPRLLADADSVIFRIPSEFIGRKKKLQSEHLVAIDGLRDRDDSCISFPGITLGPVGYIPAQIVEAAWRMVPALYQNENLHRAAVFLDSSQNRFYVAPGEIGDLLAEPNLTAPNSKVQDDWETALHAAFKSVEAVVGEPPNDERRFHRKLRNVGIDPRETFDLRRGTTTSGVLRDMHKARDSKSAHGGTRKSPLAIEEVYRFQLCARFVLLRAVENVLGRPLFHTIEQEN